MEFNQTPTTTLENKLYRMKAKYGTLYAVGKKTAHSPVMSVTTNLTSPSSASNSISPRASLTTNAPASVHSFPTRTAEMLAAALTVAPKSVKLADVHQ